MPPEISYTSSHLRPNSNIWLDLFDPVQNNQESY